MFNEKRTLYFLNREAGVSFKGTRLAFVGESKEGAPAAVETPLTPEKQAEVVKELQERTEHVEWKSKNPTENFNELAKKLYPSDAAKQKHAAKLLDEAFGTDDAKRMAANDRINSSDCKFVRLDKGSVKFYKSDKFDDAASEIKIPETDVRIKTLAAAPGGSVEQPKEAKELQDYLKDYLGAPGAKEDLWSDKSYQTGMAADLEKRGPAVNGLLSPWLQPTSYKGNAENFIKDLKEGKVAPADLKIISGQVNAAAPGAAPGEQKAVEPEKKAPGELTPEQKAAIEFFKKAFPNAKPEQIRLSTAETVTPGTKAQLYISSYEGNVIDPEYYDEAGKGRKLYPDQLRTGAYVPAEFQQGFVIEAPKKNGAMGKFVYVKLSIDPYIGGPEERMAWVEVGKLRTQRDAEKRFRTENAWTQSKETTETVPAGTYKARYETPLYSGKSATAGVIVRKVGANDEVKILEGRKTRKVNDEEYVAVEYTKDGGTDRGWIKKDAIVAPAAAAPKAPEVAHVETKDERADTAMVAKYYDRETGRIHFDGDKKAENTITISDLFPGAKAGDKIKVKHKSGGKTMEATFDPNKSYTKFINGKTEQRKGTFAYANGARVEIWDGDIILPQWEQQKTGEAPADKEKRAYVGKREIKPGETYQDLAKEAFKDKAIGDIMAQSDLDENGRVEQYVKLLKKYQVDNTVYFVVPTLEEAGAKPESVKRDTAFEERKKKHEADYEKKRSETDAAFRQDLERYKTEKIKVDPSLLSAIDGSLSWEFGKGTLGFFNDEEEWKKIWNGEGSKEIQGLDQLIAVLKMPIFVEAGITESNARQKIVGLIREYSNKEVDMEDVMNYLHLYRKISPISEPDQECSFSEFKSDIQKDNEVMKKNEAGFQAFNVKKDEVLPKLDIIKLVTWKKDQAIAAGYEDPFKLCTPQQVKDYVQAIKDMEELKKDGNYKAWEDYRGAMSRQAWRQEIMYAGAKLLEAIKGLKVKEFTAAASVEAPKSGETKRCLDVIGSVFADGESAAWYKDHPESRRFSWEDVVAGEEQTDSAVPKEFGKYFAAEAPMFWVRSRLNKYGEGKGELDGVERINEADTVKEFNKLINKGLKRLIGWKKNPTAVAEFLNKYGAGVSIPSKNEGETDEAYTTRVAPLLVEANKKAYESLKLSALSDLESNPDSGSEWKQKVEDRKELIKVGYFFTIRDEEKGLVEGAEGAPKLSMNPYIRKIQETAIAQGYPVENIKKVEDVFILGVGVKVDTTKKTEEMFGAGLGTGIPLGDGYVVTIGIGVDSSGPSLGFGIHKAWKVGEGEVGVGGGMAVGATGPSIGASIDGKIPLSDDIDLKLFAGGAVGTLMMGIGGGIGIEKNFERAQRKLEESIGEFDPKAIDAEKDPVKKYMMIISHPKIGAFYRVAAMDFPSLESQQKVVLDLYQAQRERIQAGAAYENSNPVISGGGFALGVAEVTGDNGEKKTVPWIGPYITITVDKTVYVYRRQSAMSKQMEQVSGAEVQAAILAEVAKKYPGGNIIFKETKASDSGNIETFADGSIGFRKQKSEIDLSIFKDEPSIAKFNEAIAPHDMKFVPDAATGLFELQVFGALGNLQILADPAMEKKGLILRDGKVYLAPGAKPELFITREEFFTPFAQQGSPMNTIVAITDNPKRSRPQIKSELMESGSYMYQKAILDPSDPTKTTHAQWEIMSAPGATGSNTMDWATYQANKEKYGTFSEKIAGFDRTQWDAYEAKVNGLPFMRDPEPGLTPEKQTELKSFSKKFLPRNLAKFKEYMTVKPEDNEATITKKRQDLAALIQSESEKKAPAGYGSGEKLSDLQMNFVMSEIMDLSFSELEKAPDKRARFESNLEWSKNAVLLPFFRNKKEELAKRTPPIVINSTPEQMVDFLVKRLLENVKDEDLGKPGKPLGPNWLFSSVAGAIGTGLRGVPGYMTQDQYGVLGLHLEDLSKPGLEGDFAKLILEMESPVDTANDKTFMESPLAKRVLSMPGIWFVLGDAAANQAVEGAQKALKGEPVGENAGWEAFKKLVRDIRNTQLSGGNVLIFNAPNGNSFEFRIKTQVADAAHARCGNASFGVAEDIEIWVRTKKDSGFVVAAGKESVASVSAETATRFTSFGLAGVVVIDTGSKPEEGGGGDDASSGGGGNVGQGEQESQNPQETPGGAGGEN